MNNHKHILIVAMVFAGTCTAVAQNDHHTITAKGIDGKEEVIDLPESMTQELDSLLNLYHTKTYLKPDTGCNMPDVNPTSS